MKEESKQLTTDTNDRLQGCWCWWASVTGGQVMWMEIDYGYVNYIHTWIIYKRVRSVRWTYVLGYNRTVAIRWGDQYFDSCMFDCPFSSRLCSWMYFSIQIHRLLSDWSSLWLYDMHNLRTFQISGMTRLDSFQYGDKIPFALDSGILTKRWVVCRLLWMSATCGQ